MPPPKRTKKEDRVAQTVRAPRSVGVPLGGYRSAPLTQAIKCWAKLLEMASSKAERQFTPGEWNYLAAVTDGKAHGLDPEWNDPGEQLAQLAERAATYEVGLAHLHKDRERARTHSVKLVATLRGLDYLAAWAVIWALQWRADFAAGQQPAEGEEWWTLAHRRKHLEE